jgi:hypothetical protein
MQVYGDVVRHEPAAAKLERIGALLQRAGRQRPGWQRHAELIGALVEAGELVQGLADADFRAGGDVDRRSPTASAAMALLMTIARRCASSWTHGAHAAEDAGEDVPCAALAACIACSPSNPLVVKQPEGYAFYALYPESYLEAARRVDAGASWQVIGVRSIGTSLAAMVAVGLGAPDPITLRPVGHPFERRVAADPSLVDSGARRYAVVDEGPGLSGSSIAAVVQWLTGVGGVAQERVHVFASHGRGPGPQCGPAVRAVWDSVQVHVASFDAIVAAPPAARLHACVTDLLGPLQGPLREVTGGRWRALQRWPGDLPPVHPWQERRKFIAQARTGCWLVKFAGLGRIGADKLERARALAARAWVAEPAGLCHGFIVERWRDDLAPLAAVPVPRGAARERLLQRVAGYLAFRAVAFPAPATSGASLLDLHGMGRHNTEEAFGAALASAWDRWPAALPTLESEAQRVEIDGRMHAWEWLVGDDTALKTDALDHHAGHDLVGAQDIAWDIVAAGVELGLGPPEEARLAAEVARQAGRPASAELREFLRAAYLAFQLGHWTEARRACAADEAERLDAVVERYGRALRAALERRAVAGPGGAVLTA